MAHAKAYTFVAALLRRSKNRTATNLDHYAKRSDMFAYVDQVGAVVSENREEKRISARDEAIGLERGRDMKVVNAPVIQEKIEVIKSITFPLSGIIWQLEADIDVLT